MLHILLLMNIVISTIYSRTMTAEWKFYDFSVSKFNMFTPIGVWPEKNNLEEKYKLKYRKQVNNVRHCLLYERKFLWIWKLCVSWNKGNPFSWTLFSDANFKRDQKMMSSRMLRSCHDVMYIGVYVACKSNIGWGWLLSLSHCIQLTAFH